MEAEGWDATPPRRQIFPTELEIISKVLALTLARLVSPLTPQFLLL